MIVKRFEPISMKRFKQLYIIILSFISFCFQMTYSLTRFAIYETVKKDLTKDGRVMPFYEKIGLASAAGAIGGVVGTPADLVNVRSALHTFLFLML